VIVNETEKQAPEGVFLPWMDQIRKSFDALRTASKKIMNMIWE
jgi:hypothetical protein